jgi:macrolide transport system ATP-binding/permease protein
MSASDDTQKGPPLIELRGGVRSYGAGDQRVAALNGVHLVVRAGEMVALMGASGSGKSTLLNILGCLDRLTSGTYRVAGLDTAGLDADALAKLRREHFGFVFQRYNLLGQLSALGNVETPAVYAGVAPDLRHARAKALLERLGLGDRLTHYPSQLSGGQQQRVSIARALMNEGAAILADEPTGALDSANGREVMNLLVDLNRQGHTIVIATHDHHIAEQTRRIVEFADGVILSDRVTNAAANRGATPAEKQGPLAGDAGWRAPWEDFLETARTAWQALLAHRLRTALTLLGVVIGIVSVSMMVAVGEAGSRMLGEQIGDFLNLREIVIYPGKQAGDAFAAHLHTLRMSDVEALRQQDYVEVATPQTYTSATFRHRNHSTTGSVSGAAEDYFEFHNLQFDLGQGFTRDDVKAMAPVVVIDDRLRQQFFYGVNPLGKIIYIGNLPCIVIGVLAPKRGWAEPGNRPSVIVPYTTSNARVTGRDYLDMVLIRLRKGEAGKEVEPKIIDLITKRHHVKDVTIQNNDAELRGLLMLMDTMRLLLAAIGLISLLVGGIGVMNIMLVSVTERAREIGLRLAVGARQRDIRRQFLLEAIVLCLIGAALGVLVCLAIILVANPFLPPGWTLELSPQAVMMATLCACLTGTIFGYFPARNAARLDPVEALARE